MSESSRPNICLIAAMDEHRVIGSKGAVPWHLPADFAFFKATTMGHPIVMGRKTFASIGKPLPGRTNIAITRDPSFAPEGVVVAHSLGEALERGRASEGGDTVFVVGGGEIYGEALPLAGTLYITRVHGTFDGDVRFPEWNEAEWRLADSRDRAKDEKNPYDMTFLTYVRTV
ncbi:MAG TPA: dihydrofolate reductase [Candidatus Paceibacterota bacterium]|nr:dihydrofolate reductase [Candidatus Paceibacterota bacterium]